MTIKCIIDYSLDLEIIKPDSDTSIDEYLSNVQKSVLTKRGLGVSRRLIDLSLLNYLENKSDASKFMLAMNQEVSVHRTKKVAILFREITDAMDLESIIPFLAESKAEVRLFVDKGKAVSFLNDE